MHALTFDELIDNRYRIVRRIGQGAWATVYEGIDEEQDRNVAIKILNDHLTDNAQLRARFVHEAEAATRIDSPFVVAIHAVGTLRDERPYIVMELLDGEDLGARITRDGPLEEERAVEFVINALSGLAHAHSRGVLHRDIKPDNLVIVKSKDGDEVLKIVDLGISKLHAGSHESLALTRTNVVLGSPVYMSPEQARGTRHMDHRSDIYSVGVVLYEALTGKVPHDGDNFNDLMFKIALEDVPDPRTHKPDLNPELAEIIMRALARDVEKRIQTASAFREALLEWGAQRGARIPPAPSSSRVVKSSRSNDRSMRASAEIAIDVELDDAEPPKKPDTKKADARKRLEIVETLVEGTVPVGPTLEEPERFGESGIRRRLGVFVVLALVLAAVALLVVFQPWNRAAAPPPPPAAVVQPIPEQVTEPVAPAVTLTAAQPSAKVTTRNAPSTPAGAIRKKGSARPASSIDAVEGDEGDETETPAAVDPKEKPAKTAVDPKEKPAKTAVDPKTQPAKDDE